MSEAMLEQMPHKDLVQQLATLVERDNQLASGVDVSESSEGALEPEATAEADNVNPVSSSGHI